MRVAVISASRVATGVAISDGVHLVAIGAMGLRQINPVLPRVATHDLLAAASPSSAASRLRSVVNAAASESSELHASKVPGKDVASSEAHTVPPAASRSRASPQI